MNQDLIRAKKAIEEALGDTVKVYFQLLQSWFKMRISREDFDLEARGLFASDAVHLHNEFLLSIFRKSHDLLQSQGPEVTRSIKKKKQRRLHTTHPSPMRPHFQQRFVPANPLLQAPPVSFLDLDDKNMSFASQQMLLPDITMVHGRMIVSAWEYGLEGVEDGAVRLLITSVELALKNILSAVCSYRKASKIRDKCFKYGYGTALPQTRSRSLHHTDLTQSSYNSDVSCRGSQMPGMRHTQEVSERDAAMLLAASSVDTHTNTCPTYPMSLFDLFSALQTNKSAIPSHAVYATNMERISNKLWHPSQEELDQDLIHKQESWLKEQIPLAI